LDHKAAKRAFFRIMERWGVSDAQASVLLGRPRRSTFYACKRGAGGQLPHDMLGRISYVLGIYKSLQQLFVQAEQADAWMRKANRAFGGRSALDHALGGHVVDLAAIRHNLDTVRGADA